MAHSNVETVVSPDYKSFVVCKQFPRSVGIISSFIKKGNGFSSGIIIPENRSYRIKKIYDMAPEVCHYTTDKTKNIVDFDCVEPIFDNTEIFQNVSSNSGFIHFDLTSCEVEENGKQICMTEINPRILLINYTNPKENTIKLETKKFKVEKVKIFTVMMIKGFITAMANQRRCMITFTLNNPAKNLVGSCINYENADKILKGINLMWPIFNISKKDNLIKIKLREGIITNQSKYPKLIQCERFAEDQNVIIRYAGKSIDIPE